jgi:ribosomal-protein-alanine N-acetyltransferase
VIESAFSMETPRLWIRPAAPPDALAILDFVNRNYTHLHPVEPERPTSFYTEEHWELQIQRNREELLCGHAARLFLFRTTDPARVIGTANLNQIIRGAFHSCFLGYSLDYNEQGQGLMFEALEAVIRCAFRELSLHRISANYMPHNARSGRLLKRLGFQVEGFARDYLLINGRWEDHILTSLLNPAWNPPATTW